MKYLWLLFLAFAIVGICVWQQQSLPTISEVNEAKSKDIGIKWHDSLWKHLPKTIDTTVIVEDALGFPLKFAQYIKPVFNHEAIIYQDRGTWKLHRLTETAFDSLKKDDFAVASNDRRAAYKQADTITSYHIKLVNIALMLSMADHVRVFKQKRRMEITRKGKLLFSFPINLGFSPMGNKVKEGDGKTPEGNYYLDMRYERNDKFYKSYKISYPNFEDRAIAQRRGVKPGYGVLIHGTSPLKRNAKDWTAGCIALANKDIDTLFKYVGDGTLIEIRK